MAYLYCPLCGKPRKWEGDCVCGDCFRRYDELPHPRGSLLEWTCQELEVLLPELETQFAKAKAAVDALKQRQYDVAVAVVKAARKAAGAPEFCEREEHVRLVKDQRQRSDPVVWDKGGGPRLFAEQATLQNRINHGKSLSERVEVERATARDREKILSAAATLDLDEIMAQLDGTRGASPTDTGQASEPPAAIMEPELRSRPRDGKRRRHANDADEGDEEE